MSARPATGLLVSALVRSVEGAGGSGMVLAKGDASAGAILLVAAERGRVTGLYERALGADGHYRWSPTGPADGNDPTVLADYLARRRRADPDQWVVELDHSDALKLAHAMIDG